LDFLKAKFTVQKR